MEKPEKSSWQGDDEIKETLSAAEERFELVRRTIGLFLGPLVFLILYYLPMPALSREAHVLAAILGLVVTYWVTEAIPLPVTALLGAVLAVFFRVGAPAAVMAPFAEPIVFLFLGGFILAEAMKAHSLDRRFAFSILSLSWVGSSTARILFVYGLIAAVLSMWISNTATTAMMFPIGLGIVAAMADMMKKKMGKDVDPTKLRFGTSIMLMAAYAASVGGVGTPVGTPPNLIGIAMIEQFVGIRIPFFQWMLFAVPMLAVMFIVLFILMYFLHKPEVSSVEGGSEYIRAEAANLGRWTAGQRNTVIAFAVAVVLWIMPGFLALVYGSGSPILRAYTSRLPEAIVALIAAGLLFVLPVDWKKREFTINWKQASRIDWGTLLLFGGGLSLGRLMFETKLAEAVGQGLMNLTGATSMWGITLAAIAIAMLMSEIASNTAAANMVVPVMISLAMAAGVNPIPPAIGATLGASYGFMLPVSTPPNAIVYGSGMVPITKMMRAGIVFDLIGIVIIWLGLRLLLPLVGLI
ncbi:MAG: DASS family sodium-coupled anion symporter [Dethiobacter sp.]|nr:DASS family sodium-coupled anion symporter [Dethiobacter sp.]